jgi:hypothetical protein
MIGESSGVSTLLTNERILRESPAGRDSSPEAGAESNESNLAGPDTVTISARAAVLAQVVTPAGESQEQSQAEPQGRGQGASQSETARYLDIRV